MDKYNDIQEDVAIVRAPPVSTSILSRLMTRVTVCWAQSCRALGLRLNFRPEKDSRSRLPRYVWLVCSELNAQIINKGVPVIVYDAGGIPLQVKDGHNGWIVHTDDVNAVANLLFDFHTGKKSLTGAGQNIDPNTAADEWVKKYDEPVPKINGGLGSTSEDFWTVGNATKWMYLATQVLEIPLEGFGEKYGFETGDGGNAWKLVMGDDVKEGAGEII